MLLGLCLGGKQPVSDVAASTARGALELDFYAPAAYCTCAATAFLRGEWWQEREHGLPRTSCLACLLLTVTSRRKSPQ